MFSCFLGATILLVLPIGLEAASFGITIDMAENARERGKTLPAKRLLHIVMCE